MLVRDCIGGHARSSIVELSYRIVIDDGAVDRREYRAVFRSGRLCVGHIRNIIAK